MTTNKLNGRQKAINKREREKRLRYIEKEIEGSRALAPTGDPNSWVNKMNKNTLNSYLESRQKLLDMTPGDPIPPGIQSPISAFINVSIAIGFLALVITGCGLMFSGSGSGIKVGYDRCTDYLERRASGENLILNSADAAMCGRAWGLTPKTYK